MIRFLRNFLETAAISTGLIYSNLETGFRCKLINLKRSLFDAQMFKNKNLRGGNNDHLLKPISGYLRDEITTSDKSLKTTPKKMSRDLSQNNKIKIFHKIPSLKYFSLSF